MIESSYDYISIPFHSIPFHSIQFNSVTTEEFTAMTGRMDQRIVTANL
jgi:hypothetical protein